MWHQSPICGVLVDLVHCVNHCIFTGALTHAMHSGNKQSAKYDFKVCKYRVEIKKKVRESRCLGEQICLRICVLTAVVACAYRPLRSGANIAKWASESIQNGNINFKIKIKPLNRLWLHCNNQKSSINQGSGNSKSTSEWTKTQRQMQKVRRESCHFS